MLFIFILFTDCKRKIEKAREGQREAVSECVRKVCEKESDRGAERDSE